MHSIDSLRYLVEELTAKSKRVLEYSRNPNATGLQRERIVESFIRRIAPASLAVESGFIYGPEKSSAQLDIIVYDKDNFSPLFSEGGYVIVIPASVIQVIEVKSSLNKKSLKDGLSNIISATSLNSKIQGSIFGFDGLTLETSKKHISSFCDEIESFPNIARLLPQSIVCLGKWIMTGMLQEDAICYVTPKQRSFEEQFLYYFSSLYYKMYGYRRKLHPDETLPTLESQGFPVKFEPGESDMYWIGP